MSTDTYSSVRSMLQEFTRTISPCHPLPRLPTYRTIARSLLPLILNRLSVTSRRIECSELDTSSESDRAVLVDYVNPLEYAAADFTNSRFWSDFISSQSEDDNANWRDLRSNSELAPIVRAWNWF